MPNTVCIVTNFRTASTSFTLLKSEEYGLPYKGEMFSHERPRSLGNAPGLWEMRQSNASGETEYSHEEMLHLTRDEAFLKELQKGTPCCFKIMPTHIKTNDSMLHDIISACDKVYYLYRRDFKAQLNSYLAARIGGDYSKTGFKQMSKVNSIERIRETHLGTRGKAETVVKKLDPNTNPRLRMFIANNLITNYMRMAEAYKQIPGELVCYEDYFTGDKYNPYNREIHWTEDPNLEDFDVESLFVDNK